MYVPMGGNDKYAIWFNEQAFRLAEAILAKVIVDIVEGRYFEKREEQERTFAELMDRYLNEHVTKQMSQRSFSGYTKNLLPFFHGRTLAQITPRLIVAYKATLCGWGGAGHH